MNQAVTAVSAFFPCYNDAPTIGGLVKSVSAALDRLGVDYEVIVVDDGSSDDSVAVLRQVERENPRFRLVQHEVNRGYGAALRSGFAAATKDWVFYTDGDGQYDPSEVEVLVDRATVDTDVVQGWKLVRGDRWYRKVIGRAYHHAMRLLFQLRVRDTDCDFRLIRRSLLDRVELRHSSGVICVEMMRKFRDAGAVFAEVPVHHYPREHGVSQFFQFRRIAKSLFDVLALWWHVVVRGQD
ncbi:MAG: glycosyltransferase family 2 protein [Acidimicrobiia bacterium]|nr:glycosyltransferase family 2 protein [Acidimicrobiia bacterium]